MNTLRTANTALAEMPAELLPACLATANALPEQLADGWHVLAPFGEFPEPGGNYVQVFGAPQAEAMIRSWNSIAGRSFRWLKNVRHRLKPSLSMPVFDAPPGAAHPDLDPSDWSKLPIVGEVTELRATANALEGKVVWSDAARRGDRERGPLHPSINWWHDRPDSAGRVYPEHVESITLTRTPNICTVPAWTANSSGDEGGHWVTVDHHPVFIADKRGFDTRDREAPMMHPSLLQAGDSVVAVHRSLSQGHSTVGKIVKLGKRDAHIEYDAHASEEAHLAREVERQKPKPGYRADYQPQITAESATERLAKFKAEQPQFQTAKHPIAEIEHVVRSGRHYEVSDVVKMPEDGKRTGNTTLPGTSPEETNNHTQPMNPQELNALRKSLGLPETADPAACIQAATTANAAITTLAERDRALSTANSTVSTLNGERDTLRTQHGALTTERDGLRTANGALGAEKTSLVTGILDVAQKRGIISPAERADFETRISTANTAAAALTELQTRKPAMNTQPVEINGTRHDLSTANARQGVIEAEVQKRMKDNGGDYDKAFAAVKADKNFAPVFAAMQDPAKAKA